MARFSVIFVLLLLLSTGLLAQEKWRIQGKSLVELRREKDRLLAVPNIFPPLAESNYASIFLGGYGGRRDLLQSVVNSAPKAYRYQDLAFFCRLEVQMERAFRFPVKFRLGEVQYVEGMEGKY